MFRRNKNLWVLLGLVGILLAGSHRAVAQTGAEQMQPSPYDRLGGLGPISVVVSDFIDAVVPDPLLNENPAIDASRTRVPAPYLQYHVTAMVPAAGGHGHGLSV